MLVVENQFLQLINHPHMIQAIKHIAVDLSLYRITHLLNTMNESKVEKRTIQDIVFHSQVAELYPYAALLQSEAAKLFVLPERIDQFVANSKPRFATNSRQAHSIDAFAIEAKSLISSTQPDRTRFDSREAFAESLRTQITDCGSKHFKRTPALLRAIADILMSIFYPVKLIIDAATHAKPKPYFHYFGRNEKTQRQEDLEKLTEQLPTFKPKT